MTATRNSYQDDLLARIQRSIEKGGRLTEAVLAYIETALFSPRPDRLATFLADDTDCERDSLLDLIFSPDQATQIDLEPLLEIARYSIDDEARLHGRLTSRAISAQVKMPDGRLLVGIQVPTFVKAQYLKRLKVAWQMDTRVAAVIEQGMPAALGPVVKVRLRNAGIDFTSSQQVFLCRFFERMRSSDPDFLGCLDMVLSILDTADEGIGTYDLLVSHKRSLFRSLHQAQRFSALLQRANMETLMLQGVRAPQCSPDELMQGMRLIDLTCLGVFGKIETIEQPMEEPVRQVSDLNAPEAVFQSLLR